MESPFLPSAPKRQAEVPRHDSLVPWGHVDPREARS